MAHNNGHAAQLETPEDRLYYERLEKILHDFRTPLNIIIGFSELLLDEAPGKINDAQRCALGDILDSGNRLLNQVNKIFDPSSTEIKKLFTR
jgi:signal transduction histidine kinase